MNKKSFTIDTVRFTKLADGTIAYDVAADMVEFLMPTLALLGDRSADIILDVGYTAEVQLVLTEVMYISDMTVGDPRAVTVLADLLGMASA